ncbi:MAG: methylenetetrahydrofolate reductase [Tannerella sp.]|jgi:methylenetetrahydrofolate reductase (NADPH)|nr:methylenetetrahydrofolate reductase [Tannerella sp.]
MKRVIEHIRESKKTAFSFEILPPLKGNNIRRIYDIIDKLAEFEPKYINITSHHSEYVDRAGADGVVRKVNIRRRPGSVAIASAIQNRYGITAVPHIICKGFTKEETEYALIDLNFLGVRDLLLLRGDEKRLPDIADGSLYHDNATDLQQQVNAFNRGVALDGSSFEGIETPFSYGMACYPEKHEEAPSMDSDVYYAKKKVENGADYLVTQMFFDNSKYYAFVDRMRAEGVSAPIIPGVKPIVFMDQLTVLPRIFRSEIPEELAGELRRCKTDGEAKEVGIAWSIRQCRELIAHGVPSIHFYSFMATDSVRRIAEEIY